MVKYEETFSVVFSASPSRFAFVEFFEEIYFELVSIVVSLYKDVLFMQELIVHVRFSWHVQVFADRETRITS